MLQTSIAHPAVAQALSLAERQAPELAAFSRQLFRDAQAEDLQGRTGADLAELARVAFDQFTQRLPGSPKLGLDVTKGSAIISIVNDDMPFLVDSTLALLSAQGLEVRMVLHPVIGVRRDTEGRLLALDEHGGVPENGHRESFIHIELGGLKAGAAQALTSEIETTLQQVRRAVLDWLPMLARLEQVIGQLETSAPPLSVEELSESIAFLRWLLGNHFTFLGMREYRYDHNPQGLGAEAVAASALGILRDPQINLLAARASAGPLSVEVSAYLQEPSLLILTKADAQSRVHRRAQIDYCGVKLYGADGKLVGELSIAGLFTSSAYTQNPEEIPLIRRKIAAVMEASGFKPDSHSGKSLFNVLETYPRDELLQISRGELEQIASGILRLEERPRTRVFARRDRFDRFVSAFIFLPRDRFNTELREKIGVLLEREFGGDITFFQPLFGEGSLVRVHYMITRQKGPAPQPDMAALEAEIVQAARSWDDVVVHAMQQAGMDGPRAEAYAAAFPAGYREITQPEAAVEDVAILTGLSSSDQIAAHFRPAKQDRLILRLHRLGQAIPLSERLPILENMGLFAIEETTHTLMPPAASGFPTAFIHEVVLEPQQNGADTVRLDLMRAAFLAIWQGLAENDGYNALVLHDGFSWREAALLRALGRYLRQAGITFSNAYVAQTLVKHSAIARLLLEFFTARLSPENDIANGNARQAEIKTAIEQALLQVTSLDEDRILRRFQNLITAMLRTNYFVPGNPLPLAFKFASRLIDGLPEPRPFEIFVYAPDVEGVHLRFGAIARGGLRWSDRPEDFRTEVLGLVKAQNVKNAVIVPVGAKGGFVPKRLAQFSGREAVAAEGLRCYRLFIESLLSVTDNLVQGALVPRPYVARLDGDDPYLVVAADKGTATFSDEANAIAQAHGFWLDDAFASGGSVGYDHKKMGITARGAFVAVERHFREMDRDIHLEPFTVAGVGDMSGDVFGNGMLLSRQIKLVAAFDHRDIFIDPNPDIASSFAERERLFALPRSSWQDYDKALISKGGGVFPRSLKSVPLSPQMQSLLGIGAAEATPQEVLSAILKMDVDLLWFGGIGTYVRAADEAQGDVGDKANDAIRVTAREIRAKVTGEGANLGFTQKARIEYALLGGRINTDAVDNSAGVNTSDYEVNIKIALGAAMGATKLTRAERDVILGEMTEDVAALVLRNNRLQTLCLTLARARAWEEVGYDGRVMRRFEARGGLNRALEFLPDDTQLKERELKSEGLTRPELAVLMAYSKLILHDGLLASAVPDDAYFASELRDYFPAAMRETFAAEISGHRLRREIIATLLANSMVNRLGPSFPERILEETGKTPDALARAYALARDCFGFRDLQELADGLSKPASHATRLEILLELQLLLRRGTVWFLRHAPAQEALETVASHYRQGIAALREGLPEWLSLAGAQRLAERRASFIAAGLDEETATRFASLRLLQRGPDIVQVAQITGKALADVARALFASSGELGIDRLLVLTGQMKAADFYERIAINRLLDQIFQSHRAIVANAVAGDGGWEGWRMRHQAAIRALEESLAEMTSEKRFSLARLSVAASDLAAVASA